MAPTKKPAATASKPLAPAKSAKKPQPPLRKPICVERRPNPLKLSPTRRMNDLPKLKKKPAAAPVASLRAPSNPAVPLLRTPSKKPAAAAAAASSSSKKPAAAPLKLKAAKAPLKLLKATKKKSQAKERCPICLEAFPTAAMRALRSAGVVTIGACAHSYCRPCLAQYCKTALADNKALETGGALPCPVPRCAAATNGRGGELGPWEVKALVSEEEWARHKERAEAHQIEMSTRTRFCPRAKCGAVNRVPIDATGPSTCVGCKKPFCAGAGCGLLPHAGKTCEQAAETLYGRWGKKHKVKACPTCHRHIEKNGGCNHMKCVVCKTDWDWACGKSYTGANRCTCHSNFYYPPAYHHVALPAPVGAAMF